MTCYLTILDPDRFPLLIHGSAQKISTKPTSQGPYGVSLLMALHSWTTGATTRAILLIVVVGLAPC